MCLIGVKETYVQEKKKVTKNFLGQICTTVSGLKVNPVIQMFVKMVKKCMCADAAVRF